jgi:hypothetical protein
MEATGNCMQGHGGMETWPLPFPGGASSWVPQPPMMVLVPVPVPCQWDPVPDLQAPQTRKRSRSPRSAHSKRSLGTNRDSKRNVCIDTVEIPKAMFVDLSKLHPASAPSKVFGDGKNVVLES